MVQRSASLNDVNLLRFWEHFKSILKIHHSRWDRPLQKTLSITFNYKVAFRPGQKKLGYSLWQAEADTELTLPAPSITAVGQKALSHGTYWNEINITWSGDPYSLARPKSPTFRMPWCESKRFDDLRSRCRIQLSWRWEMADNSWCIRHLTSPGKKTEKEKRSWFQTLTGYKIAY